MDFSNIPECYQAQYAFEYGNEFTSEDEEQTNEE